jgi:hypothetical protein
MRGGATDWDDFRRILRSGCAELCAYQFRGFSSYRWSKLGVSHRKRVMILTTLARVNALSYNGKKTKQSNTGDVYFYYQLNKC